MKSLLIMFSGVLVLAGCQGEVRQVAYSPAAVHALKGTELVLHQALQVAPGKARVFIQEGAVPQARNPYLRGPVDQYRPHCAFEIESVDHAGVTIHPDSFRIRAVQESIQKVVSRSPLHVAGLQLAIGLDSVGSGSYHQGYHLWLDSERQPDVRRLSCYGVYAVPFDLRPPTLAEIRETLGGVAEIGPSTAQTSAW